MSTRVVHVTDRIEGAVYIGRRSGREGLASSPLANPFTVKQYGRDEAIRRYEVWLSQRVIARDPNVLQALTAIRGKPLACWCRHDGDPRTEHNACHGDVLVELLNRYTDDELRAMGGAS